MPIEIGQAPACCRNSIERIHDILDAGDYLEELVAVAPKLTVPIQPQQATVKGILWRLGTGAWSWREKRKINSKTMKTLIQNRVLFVIDLEIAKHSKDNESDLEKHWTQIRKEFQQPQWSLHYEVTISGMWKQERVEYSPQSWKVRQVCTGDVTLFPAADMPEVPEVPKNMEMMTLTQMTKFMEKFENLDVITEYSGYDQHHGGTHYLPINVEIDNEHTVQFGAGGAGWNLRRLRRHGRGRLRYS